MQRQILSTAAIAVLLGAVLMPARVQAQRAVPECQTHGSVYVLANSQSEAFGREDYGERAALRMRMNWVLLVQRCTKTTGSGTKLAVEAIGFEKIKDPDERQYKKEEFIRQAMWNMRPLP